jgi:hypothetical protein
MSDTSNWSQWVFPPLFVGIAVVIKDCFLDGYALNDVVLITDVGINIAAYLLSDVIVHFGVDKMFASSTTAGQSILSSGTDIVIQPALQGLIDGIVRPLIHSKATLINHPITFMSSFVDGATYNIVAKYLSSPLVYYFEEN